MPQGAPGMGEGDVDAGKRFESQSPQFSPRHPTAGSVQPPGVKAGGVPRELSVWLGDTRPGADRGEGRLALSLGPSFLPGSAWEPGGCPYPQGRVRKTGSAEGARPPGDRAEPARSGSAALAWGCGHPTQRELGRSRNRAKEKTASKSLVPDAASGEAGRLRLPKARGAPGIGARRGKTGWAGDEAQKVAPEETQGTRDHPEPHALVSEAQGRQRKGRVSSSRALSPGPAWERRGHPRCP